MKITMEDTKAFEPVEIPNAYYEAEVVDERKGEGRYGQFVALSFRVTEGPQEGKVIDGLANYKLNKRTKLYKWLRNLGINVEGIQVGKTEEINVIGKKCRILTTKKETEGLDGSKMMQSAVDKVEPLNEETE